MRKTFTICTILCIAASCKNTTETNTGAAASADTTHPVYAYTIAKPDNWEMGSKSNMAIVLKSLKAYENNKIDECLSYFADSIEWKADDLNGKFSKDSIKTFFTAAWQNYASIKVDMHDFESVISKDKKDEYVTLWYVETFTDKKGKVDSVATINDIKLVNGKIVSVEEALRHFPVKK